MQKKELIAGLLVVLSTVGTVAGIYGIENYRRKKFYTVELIARAPENGNWYPQQLKIPYGMKEVKILIRNIETVTHGFAIPDLGVAVGQIKAGEVKVVRFIPDKRGTFPFMCTVWCSTRHMQMRGELIIE
ncbi:MAG: cupredoxin domain-containing protein [Candidatus Omnitrophota bacterium]